MRKKIVFKKAVNQKVIDKENKKRERFIKAVKRDDLGAVKLILSCSKSKGYKLWSPLEMALYAEASSRIVEYLIKRGEKINSVLNLGQTPLHIASMTGNASVVKLLIDHGAEIEKKNNFGCTPMAYSASPNRSLECAYLLVEAGADVNVVNRDNNFKPTPLHVAVIKGDLNFTKLLIERGADVTMTDCVGQTPFDWLTANTPHLDYDPQPFVELLTAKKAGDDMGEDEREEYQKHQLIAAIHSGEFATVRLLIGIGVDPNFECDRGGTTPLMLAIKEGREDIALLLIEKTSDLNHSDNEDQSALWLASFYNYPKLVRKLIKKGVDLNATLDRSPLEAASANGNLEIVKILVESGARLNEAHFGESGYVSTPLQIAAHHGRINVIKYLIERGVEINKKSEDLETNNWTALDFACEGIRSMNRHQETIKRLVTEKGGEMFELAIALDAEIDDNHDEIIQLLTKHGAVCGRFQESVASK